MTALRQLSRRTERVIQRQAPTFLAEAPAKPEPICHPLVLTAPATVKVSTEPVHSVAPDETYEAHGHLTAMPGETARHGNAGNDAAALRFHLLAAEEWGAPSRVAALLDDGRSILLEGKLGAILRALPDCATVKAWREAGATEFPLWSFEAIDGLRRVSWVPMDHVPVVVQMEVASRGGN